MLTVYINSSAKIDEKGQVCLEIGHPLLLDDLCRKLSRVAVAAIAQSGVDRFCCSAINPDKLKFIQLGNVPVSGGIFRKLYAYLRVIPIVWKTVQQSSFSYIFVPGHIGLIAAAVSCVQRRPYALYLRNDWNKYYPAMMRPVQKYIFAKADFVLCTGERLARKTAQLNKRSAAVVPMSPTLAELYAQPDRDYAKEVSHVLFVGQVIAKKGVYDLLEAVHKLTAGGNTNLRLTIVGSGVDMETLREAAEKRGIGGNLECAGLVRDPALLAEYFRRSQIFCFPTYYPEGFPRVLYEAMASGTPIITTPISEIGAVLRHNRNALIVEPRNVRMLSEAIDAVIRDAALRERIGLAARATVEPLMESWKNKSHGQQVLQMMSRSANASLF